MAKSRSRRTIPLKSSIRGGAKGNSLDAANSLWILELAALAATAVALIRGRRLVRHSTLVGPWRWSWLPLGIWMLASCAGAFGATSGESHGTYLAAVAALCPAIAVLGARRPTCRAWPWFVLLPMLCVLGWPAVWNALRPGVLRPLQLEAPQVMMYGLVLLMGWGNYLGTRFSPAAVLLAAALGMVVAMLSPWPPTWCGPLAHVRCAAACVAAAAVHIGLQRWPAPGVATEPFTKVWRDFADPYGMVWSRRLLDRVNFLAEQQQWPGRLTIDGFDWTGPLDAESSQRVAHALRWLLRRFVDEEWLDARLAPSAHPQAPLAVDS